MKITMTTGPFAGTILESDNVQEIMDLRKSILEFPRDMVNAMREIDVLIGKKPVGIVQEEKEHPDMLDELIFNLERDLRHYQQTTADRIRVGFVRMDEHGRHKMCDIVDEAVREIKEWINNGQLFDPSATEPVPEEAVVLTGKKALEALTAEPVLGEMSDTTAKKEVPELKIMESAATVEVKVNLIEDLMPYKDRAVYFHNSNGMQLYLEMAVFQHRNIRDGGIADLYAYSDRIEVDFRNGEPTLKMKHVPMIPGLDFKLYAGDPTLISTKALWERWSPECVRSPEHMVEILPIDRENGAGPDEYVMTAHGVLKMLRVNPAWITAGDVVAGEEYPIYFTNNFMFINHLPHAHVPLLDHGDLNTGGHTTRELAKEPTCHIPIATSQLEYSPLDVEFSHLLMVPEPILYLSKEDEEVGIPMGVGTNMHISNNGIHIEHYHLKHVAYVPEYTDGEIPEIQSTTKSLVK